VGNVIDLILGPLMPYVAAGVGALVMFLFGYRQADKARTVKELEKRLENAKKAQEVRDEVDALDDDELAARASRWVRRD
jgi:hypothetical protein